MESVIIQAANVNHKFSMPVDAQEAISIGRGFDNDVITSDPHVAPKQLKIYKSDLSGDGWFMENLDSTNPVLINRQELEGATKAIYSGDEISIGRTTFTIFSTSHSVARTREFTFTNWLHTHRFKPIITLLVLIAVFSLSLGLDALTTYKKIDWSNMASSHIYLPIMILIWSCLWSLTGRLFRHHHYFFSHLFFTALSVIIMLLWGYINGYWVFVFQSALLSEFLDQLSIIVVLGLAIGFSLNLASNMSRTFMKGFGVSGSIVIVIALSSYLGKVEFSNSASYLKSVKPPFVATLPVVDVDKHLAAYDDMFTSLEKFEKPD